MDFRSNPIPILGLRKIGFIINMNAIGRIHKKTNSVTGNPS